MSAADELRCVELTALRMASSFEGAQVDALVAALDRGRVVLHFADGPLEREAAIAALSAADEAYGGADARSLFVLQGGGLKETVARNLPRVLREAVFEIILKRVLWCVLGKAAERSAPGARGRSGARGLSLPPPYRVDVEFKALERDGVEPYASTAPPADMSSLTESESRWLARVLSEDRQLRGVGRSLRDGDEETLLLAPVRVEAAASAGQRHASRAILEVATGLLVRKVVSAARAVIERFRAGTHHGLYPTAVEEMLREFCLAHLGAAVWSGMRDEAATAFRSGAGRLLMERFIETVTLAERKDVTLVGHGSGVLSMNAFLAAFDARRGAADSPLPADFRIRNVVALAPMCTFPELAATLRRRGAAFERFRMFALTDEAERADHLVPLAYPRSLAYFVSGVLEHDANGVSAAVPLAGMARWYGCGQAVGGPEAEEARVLAATDPWAFVWSPAAGSRDGACGVRSRGEFATDPAFLANLQAMISG
jgi:hypothetical protein